MEGICQTVFESARLTILTRPTDGESQIVTCAIGEVAAIG